ncbi:hypothetical protein ACFQE1_04610 [Halobium palmae]|uniref:DOD-type homing endonuclease domain-containing protein n=1 Tax=Halobium palmae TaxID=1776492 RepID=A0ABD5RWQ8_9EURY
MSVSELAVGDQVFALDPVSGVIKRKPITAIRKISWEGPLVELASRRVDFRVAGGQRIPYVPKGTSRVEFQRAANLREQRYYKFVNAWSQVPKPDLNAVDITDFADEYEMCVSSSLHGHTFNAALPEGCTAARKNADVGSVFDSQTFEQYQEEIEELADEVYIHSGPNSRRRPYRFDGDDFIQFLGWFVTEGSVVWRNTRRTAVVKIAQQKGTHRASIRELLERMGLLSGVDHRAFTFGSAVFGSVFESLCGAGSQHKRLPSLVWSCSERQQRLLRDVLLAGDGDKQDTYYTSSDQLAGDVLCLNLLLGIKPRYTIDSEIWQLYGNTPNDGLDSKQHVRAIEAETTLYRLTVADYHVVMAGRTGKFQWIGVSGIS